MQLSTQFKTHRMQFTCLNEATTRERISKKYIIDKKNTDLNYRHRRSLVDLLNTALSDDSYDFSTILRQVPGFYCTLPWGWSDMENPRGFFEDIYRLATQGWKYDLQKASREDPSTG